MQNRRNTPNRHGGFRMSRIGAVILMLTVGVVASCASGGGGLTEEGYVRPSENSNTRTAVLHLARAVAADPAEARPIYQQALTAAMLSISEDPENPQGYYLAGQASAGAGDYVAADTLFDKALEMYPPYEAELEIEREAAWIMAYNEGVQAVNNGDVDRAGELFAQADMLYRGRPEALMNLAWVHLQNDDTEAAMGAYRAALDIIHSSARDSLPEDQLASWADSEQLASNNLVQLLARGGNYADAASVLEEYLEYNPEDLSAQINLAEMLGRAGQGEQATAIYDSLLNQEGLRYEEFFQIGIGFFNAERYGRAGEAFDTAAILNPHSRDAWYNMVQARYSAAMELARQKEEEGADVDAIDAELQALYQSIVEGADHVIEYDPFNRNILTFVARAYRGLGELAGNPDQYAPEVQEVLRRYQNAPIEIIDVRMRGSADNPPVEVSGSLQNVSMDEGAPIRLHFTLLGEGGMSVGSTVIEVAAPAVDGQRAFSGTIQPTGAVIGWNYALVQ